MIKLCTRYGAHKPSGVYCPLLPFDWFFYYLAFWVACVSNLTISYLVLFMCWVSMSVLIWPVLYYPFILYKWQINERMICNNIYYKVWGVIAYSFPNSNSVVVGNKEWMTNLIPHLTTVSNGTLLNAEVNLKVRCPNSIYGAATSFAVKLLTCECRRTSLITVVRLMKPTAVGFIRYGRRRSDRIKTARFVWYVGHLQIWFFAYTEILMLGTTCVNRVD